MTVFIGHYGVGFALKKLNNQLSLGLLFLAVQLPDILWNIFVLLGIEKVRIAKEFTTVTPLEFISYPFSHSLLSNLILALIFYMIIVNLKITDKQKVAGIIAVAILSHFLLDFISHTPDLPVIFSDSPKIGLGLWNHVWVSYTVESLIFIIGFILYYRETAGLKKWKRVGMSVFAFILLCLNLINLLGKLPPSPEFLASTGLLYTALFTIAAYWLDG